MEGKGGPKFSNYWIYGMIALFLFALQLFKFSDSGNPLIDLEKFRTMAKNGAVEKVEVINLAEAQVYIKKDSLVNYKDAAQSKLGSRPHFTFNIGPPDEFDKEIKSIKEGLPDNKNFTFAYVTNTDWTPLIGWIFPILIIVAIWLFITLIFKPFKSSGVLMALFEV